jgi:SAM-dependent methyltransferase
MNCRICSSNNFELILDLGLQPWCNNFLPKTMIGTEPYYPLRLVYCNSCFTSQLDYTVNKEVMFADHTYLSGITRSLSDHFKKIAYDANIFFSNKGLPKNVLDIGSNDGTQLRHFKDLGWEVLGVESSVTTSKIASESGINTLNQFFNYSTAKEINKKFDVINAAGVFFHLEELHSVTEGIKFLLDDKGVFIVQFLYMKNIMENNAFDQIYHEHLLYYTLSTLGKLLSHYDLEIFDAHLTSIHGGQMIAYVSHINKYPITNRYSELLSEELNSKCNEIENYINFSNRVKAIKKRDLDYLYNQKKNGKMIYAMGAPVKGNTLLNYFDIGPDTISYLVEKNPLRKNLFSPGKHIPVILESEIIKQPDIYYVLAWNFKNEILQNNTELIKKGIEFYFPINI